MSGVLKGLEPAKVFEYFEEISKIPRGSGNEKEISDYLVQFAKQHNLEYVQDKILNVIIKKRATVGYENAPVVIIQGHMDMVNEKNKNIQHDFEKDPIQLRVVEDWIYGTDTTLGADNGIAVAMGLALLASKDIPHPALEVLLTADEESTMGGALGLDASCMKGKLLINIDSEEEGKLLVSSAGGRKTKLALPILWEAAEENFKAAKLSIGGLKGGHSGIDIDKGRGNANKLMGRLLNALSDEFNFRIASINGGLKSNAITREAEAFLSVKHCCVEGLAARLAEWENLFKNELRAADPDVYIKLEMYADSLDKVFSQDTMEKAIAALVILPSGVQSMSMHIQGLVESSTNLGVVQTTGHELWFVNEIRSSVRSLKDSIYNQVKAVGDRLGCKTTVESDYPEWEYNPDSKLRQLFEKVYKEKYGVEAQIVAIHAGLECGVLSEKIKGLDCISIGPNLHDVHTPKEHLSIASTKNVWEYLLEVLKEMKE